MYFGTEAPGISIDPISVEADRQLVRFIGNVVGTALGKAMLDADYYMKKTAVGTERPPILGFRSVDDLVGRHGIRYAEVGRRFWFVPADMRFRRAGDALLFEGGRMTLLTEKLLRGASGETDATDQAFARFWTDHYWEFAAVNPVLEELFDYARLIALARYLKASGVGLQGFLMANRHLVARETIPGSVPALRARSNVLRGVEWVGGVDLATDMSAELPERYVVDDAAAVALRRAYATGSVPVPVSREGNEGRVVQARLDDGAYTLTPAQGLGAPPTGAGGMFHTDLALRAGPEPGVELLRLHTPGRPGSFGNGWQLYLPYAIAPAGDETVRAAQVAVQRDDETTTTVDLLVPRRMAVVDLIDGRREMLTFDSERFGIAAWVPSSADSSRFDGMAYLSDGSCLLFERTGARFRFDGAGRLTDVMYSTSHTTHYDYDGPRVVHVRDGFGGSVRLEYDDAGRVARGVGPFGAVEYRYLADELVQVRRPDGTALTLIYRADGTLDETVIRRGGSLEQAALPAASAEG